MIQCPVNRLQVYPHILEFRVRRALPDETTQDLCFLIANTINEKIDNEDVLEIDSLEYRKFLSLIKLIGLEIFSQRATDCIQESYCSVFSNRSHEKKLRALLLEINKSVNLSKLNKDSLKVVIVKTMKNYNSKHAFEIAESIESKKLQNKAFVICLKFLGSEKSMNKVIARAQKYTQEDPHALAEVSRNRLNAKNRQKE